MKKNFTKIIIMILLVFSLTGCTKYLKDKDGKIIKNEITGQNLPSNILCQPEDKNVIKIYKENKVKISKLPKCTSYSITDGSYEGLWDTIFVKPLAWLILKVGQTFKSYGLAIVIVILLIRMALYPVTKKTAMQSENMKNAKPELDRLEKKYAGKDQNDQNIMMQKSTEMLAIYKKYNINPMSGCLFSFIQIPLFFAFYEALYRLPAIYEDTFLGFELGTTPSIALSKGNYLYLIFTILVVAMTYFSFKLNSTATMSAEQESQMKMMSTFMVVFIGIASFSISTGIAVYWISNSLFTIIQNLLVKRRRAVK